MPNRVYYDWAKRHLSSIDLWAKFQAVLDGSDNTERIADVVETALGLLIIAERVAELKSVLDKLLRPHTNTAALFQSLCVSLHSHTGCQ
jgi:hypothetical protein